MIHVELLPAFLGCLLLILVAVWLGGEDAG